MSKEKRLGFVLGLIYAPFFYFTVQSYFYIGSLLGAVIWSTETIGHYTWFLLYVVVLFMAVMGLITVMFPIWFYLRFMRDERKR